MRADRDLTVLLVPRWFAALLLGGVGYVLGAGLVGLALAIAGVFDSLVAFGAGAVGAAGGVLLAGRVAPHPAERDRRRAGIGAALAVVAALAFVAANWDVVGGSVMLERDPGLYSATARWLDREGSLAVDARIGPFAGVDDLRFVSVGMYDLDDTTLEFQSNHLAPVVFATGYGVGGAAGLRHVPLALVGGGLLAVYALATRMTGRVWASLAVVVALASCLPLLLVARDTLSEPVVLLLLWAGLWLWTVAADTDRPAAAAAAGLCLGACLATRIDAAVYLVPVPLALGVLARSRGWRLAWPLALGLGPGAAAAFADVGLRSRGYLGDLEVEVASLYGLLVLATVAAVVTDRLADRRLRPVERLFARRPAGVATLVAGAVVAGLLLLWFVRPHVQEARADDSTLVTSIQGAEGEEIDGRRRYHELSMVWQGWYLGPVVLGAAVVGAGLLARRLVAARSADTPLLVPAVALGAGTLLYLARPAIAPDQLWAMRRFVPAALPLWCVLAGVAAVAGVDALRRMRWPRPARAVAAGAAVTLALVPVVARTWPVRAFREQDGFLAIIERTCAVVGDDAAVVLPEESTVGATFTQTLRSWCDVPVALLRPSASSATVDSLASAWAAEGRELWLVADTVEQLATYAPASAVVELGPVSSTRFLEDTLTSPPDDYSTFLLNAVATRAAGG